ncbi:hypothetical protein DACRYDRAFT_25512 [Dacryopinax primogenitus]|uniref:PB1 domain-containing protein n=1 Tax=Dacryopinax primogenitus (strain DJM 731) TaxID=1858805 RepID=M5FTY7_DACPD|nr:uncharacterized protein DACRYDRAFT_25512 [Dacryopinax primogenitus]EJT96671.1 hypothetical protein DACRYDRAFT_25512 [Dacryopinax primogenitus]
MSLSLKQELETWAGALKAYDEEDFESALQKFEIISESSKIQVNIGLIFATVGSHEQAVDHFRLATGYDQFLSVAYFQCGVSNFLLNKYEEAYKDFEDSVLYLRGNQAIMYEQLGLKFTLCSCEVLFNKGLCLVYLGQVDQGIAIMRQASLEKTTTEHSVIDEAIAARGIDYTVFSIPIGVLYRPSEIKLKNSKAKDYMGKAKLVAAADSRDAYVSFVGSTRLAQGMSPTGAPLPEDVALARSRTMNARMRDGSPERDDAQPARRSDEGPRPSLADKSLPGVPPVTRGLTVRREGVGGPGGPGGLPRAGPMKVGAPGAPKIDTSSVSSNATARMPEREGEESRFPTPKLGTPIRGPGLEELVFSGNNNGPRNELGLDISGTQRRRSNEDTMGPPRLPYDSRNTTAMTNFDDFLDSYAEPINSGQASANKKLAQWARGVPEGAAPPLAQSPSSPRMDGVPGLSFSASSTESGVVRAPTTIKRKITRRATTKGDRYVPVTLEDDELSDLDFEEVFELVKVRVKLHYRNEVRGMAISPTMGFDEFVDRVTRKFQKSFDRLEMKFKDEDGVQISLKDESDFDLAIETARETAKGRPEGKLQVWLADI